MHEVHYIPEVDIPEHLGMSDWPLAILVLRGEKIKTQWLITLLQCIG